MLGLRCGGVSMAAPRRSVDSPRWPGRPHPTAGAPVVAEAMVRHWLREDALASAGQPSDAVYEFWVPRSNERADVVVISNEMSGFEIKSERDTLQRLPRQAAAYARLFDRCSVVLAERHLVGAVTILPEWWGVIVIVQTGEELSFRHVRSAGPNPDVDPETLVRLLWREEVRSVLSALGREPDRQASRASMWQQLLDVADLDRLKDEVRGTLLRRDRTVARIPTRRFRG
jgi:hypothetical protein